MKARLPEVPYRPTVPVLLRRAVELYDDSDFVVLPDERLSFAEAERRSRAMAVRLLAYGAGKGTRIGIVLPSGVDWVVAWLAAARIGALAMLFPATYRPEELRRSLVIGDVALLFAPQELFGKDYAAFLASIRQRPDDRIIGVIEPADSRSNPPVNPAHAGPDYTITPITPLHALRTMIRRNHLACLFCSSKFPADLLRLPKWRRQPDSPPTAGRR